MSPKLTMLKESVVFVAIVLVLTVIYNFAATPLSIIWGVFVGVEIHSESSFPLGHMLEFIPSLVWETNNSSLKWMTRLYSKLVIGSRVM